MSVRVALHELTRFGATWVLDIRTAEDELEAKRTQASVIAVFAFAWRVAPVLVLASCIGTACGVAFADWPASTLVLTLALSGLAPVAVAFLLTWPLGFWAMLQSFVTGSREARLRFGVTDTVFPYYGWRYAFRARTRPWGALTHEERVAQNPKRAGVRTGSEPRRNYWPN